MTKIHEEKKVIPQTLKGFQDYLPEEMVARQAVLDKIRAVYERYGFAPVDTPILEYLVTLIGTGGDETNKQMFRLESAEREPIAMRFDLTVPFSRLIAQYPQQIPLPFRRYHMGPVFRDDKPGPGRFRQFTQFDLDAAGSDSVAVDAEIIAAICDVMKELDLHEAGVFQVSVNNRKLFDALLSGCDSNTREKERHILRVVDKLKKVGMEAVRQELGDGRVDESGDPIRGVGLSVQAIDLILAFIAEHKKSRGAVVESLAGQLPNSEASTGAIREMFELAGHMESLKIPEYQAIFDPALARGLDYYTGPIFEATWVTAPEFGSFMGGGRYNKLAERFMTSPIPATGASIGIDRFMSALAHMGKIKRETTTQVLIVSLPGTPVDPLLSLAGTLRAQKIPTEVYFGAHRESLRNQMAFANQRGIPVAVILGEDELKAGTVSVKDLKAGLEKRAALQDREAFRGAGKSGQFTVSQSQLIEAVQRILNLAS
jgi:histidyl-tRNA synthetase